VQCGALVRRAGQRHQMHMSNIARNPLEPTYDYSDAMGEAVLQLVAQGKSLVDIGKLPGYPGAGTVMGWLQREPDFAQAMQLANAARAEYLVDEALSIADDSSQDYQYKTMRDGRQELVYNHEHPARAKLRVQARQWIAARLDRNAWGDKSHVSIDQRILTVNLTDEEIDKRLAAAQARLLELNPE
jgi:hypothetical protein